MVNKALVWSFYVSFCTFCASLRLKRTVFSRLQIKVRPKGLHSFAFYILIFNFSSHLPLTSLRANTYVPIRHPFPHPYSLLLTPYSLFLRACKSLYNCRETFTDVMSALQIQLFLQNKAKFKKAKMNVSSFITKDYENKSPIRAPKKQSQTLKRQKPMQTSLPQRIMKISALLGPDKTKPNKPNLSRCSLWRSRNLSRRSLWRRRIKANKMPKKIDY